jgi:hypothetical protein
LSGADILWECEEFAVVSQPQAVLRRVSANSGQPAPNAISVFAVKKLW